MTRLFYSHSDMQPGPRRVFNAGWRWIASLALALASGQCAFAGTSGVLDHFEDLQGWTTVAAPGAQASIASDEGYRGKGLRVDFDFRQGGGFIIVHKVLPVALPANYAFRFFLRGEAPRNNLEFRLVDPSNRNVWWHRKRDYSFSDRWQEIVLKPHHLEFAWGPAGGGIPKQVQTLEFAVSVSEGGKGTLWFDELRLERREPPPRQWPRPEVRASSSAPGQTPRHLLESDSQIPWRSGPQEEQWLTIDLRKQREYGGLSIDWDEMDYATGYEVQASDTGKHWQTLYTVASGNGGRDPIYLPDGESRFLRLLLQRSSRQRGYGIHRVKVEPHEFSASPNDFFKRIAQDAPAGSFPKYFQGQQSYWTLIGASGDDKEALLNEEGMLELEKGGFSLEPFVYLDGKLITWNDVAHIQRLEKGYLPIPSVTWQHPRFRLTITGLATGQPDAGTVYARYRIENSGSETKRLSLFLSLRPFQVNPPWQSLNMVGGVGRITDLHVDGRMLRVNGDRTLISLSAPDGIGVASFASGTLGDWLSHDTVPPAQETVDPLGFASGALRYALELEPREAREIVVAMPLHDTPSAQRTLAASGPDAAAVWRREYEAAVAYWEEALTRVDIRLPPGNQHLVNTLRSNLAYILINRDGPALRPGSRCYARTWMRDGALSATALLNMGHVEEVRDFITWYAGYQRPDGEIPCCMDPWGPDTAVEHDSQGEFIYLVAEYYRHTGDLVLLKVVWPHVVRAVEHIEALRAKRLTTEFKAPDKLHYFGLMPESISHEGYAAHPVHSYWDDFWVLRGLKDAVEMAEAAGDRESLVRFAQLRDAFHKDFYASIGRTQTLRGVDFIPASADLGDYDPTSTAIALDPGGEQQNLPAAALNRTFSDYGEDLRERIEGRTELSAYSPYEFRNVTALVRLGKRDEALQAIEFFLKDRRPLAWNHWAEVVWRDPGAPRFIGDMPHTWVGSDYIRAVRSLLAFERESDRSLVIGAGLPRKWIEDTTGVSVSGMPTHYGPLSYHIRGDGGGGVRLTLESGLQMPPGKLILELPADLAARTVKINDRSPQALHANRVIIDELPAEVRIR
ncbi:MAG: putative discoidin domain protein [Proteobacteria bacterium]|nr:putative discoidin domain protein [Pseudomonadota bacterium]